MQPCSRIAEREKQSSAARLGMRLNFLSDQAGRSLHREQCCQPNMAEENYHATFPRARSPQFEAGRQRATTTTEYEDRCRSEALAALELEGVDLAKDPKVLGTGAYGSVIELRFRGK